MLADFIDQGYFARHLRRMRTLYAERQQALIDAAGTFLDGIMSVPPLDSGLHLIGWLEQGVQESHVLDAASRIGLEIAPVSVFSSDFLHSAPAKDSCKVLQKPGLILGYAAYSNEEIHYHIKLLGKACASNPLWPG